MSCRGKNVKLPYPYVFVAAIVAAGAALRADLRRRRLTLTARNGWHALTALDVACVAAVAAVSVAFLVWLLRVATAEAVLPLRSVSLAGALVGGAAFFFLWHEGLRQVQFQRPRGIVLAEALILAGGFGLFLPVVLRNWPNSATGMPAPRASIFAIVLGVGILVSIVPPFVKKGAEYQRIVDHLAEQGESVQREYTPATPECAHPELWHMADSQSTELEVLEFLRVLVTTIKPRLVVETGTFLGYGALALALGLKSNGFGRLITIEYDPAIYATARERIQAAGLADWVEMRNESSTETKIDGAIDLLFSDSALSTRESEVRQLLPQIGSNGLIVIHDASSHFAIVREAALRMEREGLISAVMLPTPRGLVLACKRDGRTFPGHT